MRPDSGRPDAGDATASSRKGGAGDGSAPPGRVRASRSLLFPGPQPPSTHLGLTLARHVVGAATRYALYQLGLEPPPIPPVRIHRLRIHLDRGALEKHLRGHPAAGEVLGALLDPGGRATAPLPHALRAAALFHRARLGFWRRPPELRSPPPATIGGGPHAAFRGALSGWTTVLGEAFLAETLSSLERRQKRRRGRPAAPAMSREAGRFRSGRRARLACLGPPDPVQGSWAETGPPASALGLEAPPEAIENRLRGCFREHFRLALDALRPSLLALGAAARDRAVLDRREDAFFLPLDLIADLESEARPRWLDAAVAANRLEYETELARPPAPEVVMTGETGGELLTLGGSSPDWSLAPLAPLP